MAERDDSGPDWPRVRGLLADCIVEGTAGGARWPPDRLSGPTRHRRAACPRVRLRGTRKVGEGRSQAPPVVRADEAGRGGPEIRGRDMREVIATVYELADWG